MIFAVACVVSGLVVSFVIGPLFAIINFGYFPILFIVITLLGGSAKNAAIAKIMHTGKLGGVVEESLSAIKLVSSFANEDKELKKFAD